MVDSEGGFVSLQQDLDQLERWAKEWQMNVISDTCEVLHFGISKQGRTCTVNSRATESVAEQRNSFVWPQSTVYNSLVWPLSTALVISLHFEADVQIDS